MPGKPLDSLRDVAPTSLYVHIPFCKSRCFYCDFNTYVAPDTVMVSYMDALDKEFESLAKQTDVPLRTVFFGGGTPTLPSAPLLEQMLESLHRHFEFADDAEMTFESNPDSIDEEKLRVLHQGGVTRLSFGAQTFRDRLLLTIGRSHDADAVRAGVQMAANMGFKHINVDLMFGLPEQTLDDVEYALNEVLQLPVDHVSAYWLKVEPGTPFATWRESGALPLPGEDMEADMYDVVRDTLQANGFHHYEISNFARDGGEAKHNLVYWRNQPYLAAGAGAHGYVRGVRYENVKRIADYLERLRVGDRPIADSYSIPDWDAAEDMMMLGLRLHEGVDAKQFEARFGCSPIDIFGDTIPQLTKQGLLDFNGTVYRIPEKYWPVANVIFEKFVSVATAD